MVILLTMKLLSNFQFRLKTQFKKNSFAVSLSKRTFNDLGGNSPRYSRKNLLTVAAAGVAAATAFTATPASAAFFFNLWDVCRRRQSIGNYPVG